MAAFQGLAQNTFWGEQSVLTAFLLHLEQRGHACRAASAVRRRARTDGQRRAIGTLSEPTDPIWAGSDADSTAWDDGKPRRTALSIRPRSCWRANHSRRNVIEFTPYTAAGLPVHGFRSPIPGEPAVSANAVSVAIALRQVK